MDGAARAVVAVIPVGGQLPGGRDAPDHAPGVAVDGRRDEAGPDVEERDVDGRVEMVHLTRAVGPAGDDLDDGLHRERGPGSAGETPRVDGSRRRMSQLLGLAPAGQAFAGIVTE